VLLVVAGVLPGFLTTSLAPRIRADFPFGASELGLAVGAFYAVCTPASSPCGHLVERIGARAAVRASAAATAACTVAIALLAGSTAGLIVPLLLGGVGNAAAAPAAGALLDQHVPAGRKGLALGVMQASAPLGALLAGLALPAVAIPLGWQWGYVVVGVLAMLAEPARSCVRVWLRQSPQVPRSLLERTAIRSAARDFSSSTEKQRVVTGVGANRRACVEGSSRAAIVRAAAHLPSPRCGR
jgi:MFS family permease